MKEDKDIFAAHILDILPPLSKIGLRRPSIEGFNQALNINTALNILDSYSSNTLMEVIRIQLLRAKTTDLERKTNYIEALEAIKEALRRTSSLGIPSLEIAIKAQSGNMHRRLGRISDAKNLFNDALEQAKNSGITLFSSWIQYELGYLGYLKGSFKEASEFFNKSVMSAKGEEDVIGQIAGLGLLTQQYYFNGDLKNALKCLDDAEGRMSSKPIPQEEDWNLRWRNNLLIYRGNIEIIKGNFAKSKSYFKKANKITIRLFGEAAIPVIYIPLGSLALANRDIPNAIYYFSSALRIYEQKGDLETQESCSEILAWLGKSYILNGNDNIAMDKFEQALTLPADFANRRGHAWAHIEIAKMLYKKGKKQNAKKHLQLALDATSNHYHPEQQIVKSLLRKMNIPKQKRK